MWVSYRSNPPPQKKKREMVGGRYGVKYVHRCCGVAFFTFQTRMERIGWVSEGIAIVLGFLHHWYVWGGGSVGVDGSRGPARFDPPVIQHATFNSKRRMERRMVRGGF